MKKLLIITLTVFTSLNVVLAKTDYSCVTPEKNNRSFYTKGTLSFTDTTENGLRVITNVKAYIRASRDRLKPEIAEWGDYVGTYSFNRMVEDPKYPSRAIKYKNHSQFQDFDTEISRHENMYGELVIEKTSKPKQIEAIYQFRVDQDGGVIDFICKPSTEVATPVTIPSQYYQSVIKLKAVLSEAVRSLKDPKITKELGKRGGKVKVVNDNGNYSLETAKCMLRIDVSPRETGRFGQIPFEIRKNTYKNVMCTPL